MSRPDLEYPGLEYMTSFDGTEIAYRVEGVGPAVLLMHGFAADHDANWVRPGVFAGLVAAGHRVIAYDARAHGRSAKPYEPEKYGPAAMPGDAGALLDHLGVAEVDVVGYSMGAVVAVRWLQDEPRARRAVFGGIGMRGAQGRAAARRSVLADALLTDDPRAITEPIARAFRRFADSTGADRRALAAMQGAPRAEPPDLTNITVPALVLVGADDTLAGSPDELVRALPNAIARTVEGNHLTATADPMFTKHIVEFLEPA